MTLCEPHNSNYYGGIRCPRQKIPPNSSLAQKECASSMRIFSPIIVFHAVKLILCHRTTEESRIHDDSSNRSFTQHMNPNMQLIKKLFLFMNKFYHLVPVFILSMHVSQYMEFRFINTYMDLPDPFFKIVLIVESLKA